MNQIQLDQALILNENFLKSKPFYFKDIDLMNTDDKFFHYRINCHGIDMKKINLLKKNGYSIKSIYPTCTDMDKFSISLKWKISL